MAFEKLRQIRCFPAVDKKIRAGVPCENVAEWIQDDQNEYTDIKRDSLVRQLYRYKEAMPPALLDHPEPLHIRKKIENLKRGVNEADELEKLYLLQLTRISRTVENEDKMNFLLKETRKEIDVARMLLLDLAKLKIEIGVYNRQPLAVTGEINHRVEGQLESIDPTNTPEVGGVAGVGSGGLQELLKGASR